LALRLAIEAWDGSGRTLAGRWELRSAARREYSLRAIYRQSAVTSLIFPLKRLWWRKVRYRYGKWWWARKLDAVRASWRWVRDEFVLLSKLKFIASGKPVHWLQRLSREAHEKNSGHWTTSSWTDLERKRGKWITRAAKSGCAAFWRGFTPLLPHEKPEPGKTDIRLIVGLTGLQVEFD